MKKIVKLAVGIFICLLFYKHIIFASESASLKPDILYNGIIVTKDGDKYFYDNGEMVVDCWETIAGDKYYFGSDGKAVVGSKKIKKNYYIFNEDGKLFISNKATVVKVGKNKYCVKAKGKSAPGWHYIKGKVYYADKRGKCAMGKKVSYISFSKNGYAKNTDQALAKMLAREFINAHCDNKMSKAEKFRTCFRYIIANTNFVGSWRPKRFEKKGWQYRVAVSMFQTDLVGSCYGISSAIAAIAKELGYKPYVISTTAGHSFVIIGNKYYDNMNGAVFGASSHSAYIAKEKFKF